MRDMTCKIDDMAWRCKQCGYRRQGHDAGFKLLGKGRVQCPQCKAIHIIAPDNSLVLIEKEGKSESNRAGK